MTALSPAIEELLAVQEQVEAAAVQHSPTLTRARDQDVAPLTKDPETGL